MDMVIKVARKTWSMFFVCYEAQPWLPTLLDIAHSAYVVAFIVCVIH